MGGLPRPSRRGAKDILFLAFLNVDNSMLTECQNLVDAKMNEVCGSTTECNAFASDEKLGAGSLRSQKAPNGNYLISGLIQFGMISVEPGATSAALTSGKGTSWFQINTEAYQEAITAANTNNIAGVDINEIKATVFAELDNIQGATNRIMEMIATDPKISMCI
ncbi:MAG: hypothetical protein LBG89_03955, partial [Rickettsiales bacterium]|nr:hypothetical protein [Rickettsiales bacterium]